MSLTQQSSSGLTFQSTAKMLSGYEIPLIGLGVYQAKPEETIETVVSALEVGYTHIDTAIFYLNETEVGQGIKKSGVPRENVFITTKLTSFATRVDPKMTFDTEGAQYAVDASLKKLGVDYIDLFLLHDPLAGREGRIAAWKGFIKARDAGKIRSIGVSSFGIHHLKELEEAGLELPSVNQIELHPECQQRELVAYCQQRGIVVEAYSPIGRAQYLDDPILVKIAKKHNKSESQVLLRWGLQKGFVILPKSVKKERQIANASLFDFELSPEEMADVDTKDRGVEGVVSTAPDGGVWFPVDAP